MVTDHVEFGPSAEEVPPLLLLLLTGPSSSGMEKHDLLPELLQLRLCVCARVGVCICKSHRGILQHVKHVTLFIFKMGPTTL